MLETVLTNCCQTTRSPERVLYSQIVMPSYLARANYGGHPNTPSPPRHPSGTAMPEGYYLPTTKPADPDKPNQFPLGSIVMTANLQHRLSATIPESWAQELQAMINRHVSGDWGDLEEFDRQQNHNAVKDGSRIFSAYHTSDGTKVWIITEADRSSTTALLPEDY